MGALYLKGCSASLGARGGVWQKHTVTLAEGELFLRHSAVEAGSVVAIGGVVCTCVRVRVPAKRALQLTILDVVLVLEVI